MEKNIFIGIDLGDKTNFASIVDYKGNEIAIKRFRNTKTVWEKFATAYPGATVGIEACIHSPWVSRILEKAGLNVYVGNPRKLRCIWDADDKTDLRDARMLARIVRFDPKLMCAIQHRSEDTQRDLQIIKARDALVETRTALVNSVRTGVKVLGERLPSGWSTRSFAKKAIEILPVELLNTYLPMLESIQLMSDKIDQYEKTIKKLSETKYPETEKLKEVNGVGPITALAYILTIEDAGRFKKSREVGPYLGLVPKRDQSGDCDKQLHITKAGNKFLRGLLIGCAQYILGPFGAESELREYGLRIAERGGKNAKKRAVVAVARKLAVLLHRLWVDDAPYDAFFNRKNNGKASAA